MMFQRPTLFVLIGVSGSGKSTFAKTFSITGGVRVVSADEIRGMLYGDESVQKDGKRVFEVAYMNARCHLSHCRNVIFDATNTTKAGREKLLDALKRSDCRKVAVLCMTDIDTCIKRNARRDRVVPEHVIRRQYAQLLEDGAYIPDQFDEIIFVKGR